MSEQINDGGPAFPPVPDPSNFHYYDRVPEFSAKIRVTGTSSITVQAATQEEAEAEIEAMIDAAFTDNSIIDLLEPNDVHDADIIYVSARPTRMYLVDRPGLHNTIAVSRLEPGDKPRPPTDTDVKSASVFLRTVSWKPEDVVATGGAA